MEKIIEMFKGDNLVPAVIVTIAAFVLGFLAKTILGALCRGNRR